MGQRYLEEKFVFLKKLVMINGKCYPFFCSLSQEERREVEKRDRGILCQLGMKQDEIFSHNGCSYRVMQLS